MRTTLASSLLALSLITACSPQQTEEQRIAAAIELYQQGKQNQAVIELKNVLQQNPENYSARLELGTIYLAQGRAINAHKELDRAFTNDFEVNESARLLAETYYQLHYAEDLEKLYENKAQFDPDTQVVVSIYTAMSNMFLGQREQAEQKVAEAVALDPQHRYSRLGQAWLLASEQSEQSLELVNSLLAEDAEFGEAQVLKGHLLSAEKDYAGAAAAYRSYIEARPFAHEVKTYLVNALSRDNKLEEAEEQADILLSFFPKQPLINEQKAVIRYRLGDYENAKLHADITLENFASLTAGLVSGLSAYQLGKLEQAYEALEKVEPQLDNGHPVKKLYSYLQMELGYRDEAAESLLALEGLSEGDTNFLRSSSLRMWGQGDADTAEALLDKATSISPSDPELLTQMAVIKLAKGDQEGMEILEKSLDINPSLPQTNFALALQLYEAGKLEQAQQVVASWKEGGDNLDQALVLDGIIKAKQKNYGQAQDAFKQAIELNPDNVIAQYYAGVMAEYHRETESALQAYQKVLNKAPEHRGAFSGYFRLVRDNDLLPQAETFFQELAKQHPNSINSVKGLVLLYLNQDKPEQADALLKQKQSELSDSARFLDLAGDAYLEMERPEEALTYYDQVLRFEVTNLRPHLKAAHAALLAGKDDQAESYVAQALSKYGDQDALLLADARIKVKRGQFEQALKSVNRVGNKEGMDYLRLVASISFQVKDYLGAADAVEKLYQQQPNGVNALSLTRALNMAGEKPKAIEFMKQHLAKFPEDDVLRFALAEHYTTQQNWGDAKTHYQSILEKSPQNLVAVNNLAWIFLSEENYPEALKYAEQAHGLAPDNKQVVDTYAYTLFHSGEGKQALQLFKGLNLSESASEDVDIKLHFAEVLIAEGESEQAKSLLQALEPSLKADLDKKDKLLNNLAG